MVFIVRFIGGGFFGVMVDKYGCKLMMMWVIFIYLVGIGFSGIVINLYMFVVCCFIVGLGMFGEYVCVLIYVVESWFKNF